VADEYFSPPDAVPKPRSGLLARAGRLYFWVRAALRWSDAPTAAAFEEVCYRLQAAQDELLRTQTELAVAKAQRDAYKETALAMAEVNARDRERVRAEAAMAAAAREAAVNRAADAKAARTSAAD